MAEGDDITVVSLSLLFSNFRKLQIGIFTSCLIAFLSPIFAFLSLFSDSFNADKTTETVESAVKVVVGVPSTVVHEGSFLLKRGVKKLAIGLLAAIHTFVVLVLILGLSFMLGIGLVHRWVEQPVSFREDLHFDYTQNHPAAVFTFAAGGYKDHPLTTSSKVGGVPIGQTVYVSMLLLLPESDYNREIGVFQITTELISSNGEVMENASYPCMLQYRTRPIRMIRTFSMGLPLLLGITRETQTIEIAMIKHKESIPRSAAVRIILSPRAGTDFLPQLYDAKVLLNSKLRWWKEQIYRWKWTFYVWTSMSIYSTLILLVLFFFRPFIIPEFSRVLNEQREREQEQEQEQVEAIRASEVTEAKHRERLGGLRSRRRLPRSRSRAGESSAISMTLPRDGSSLKSESGESESASSMPTKPSKRHLHFL